MISCWNGQKLVECETNYQAPLTYFDSIAAPDGSVLLINFTDANNVPVSLMLDRREESAAYNQLSINQTHPVLSDDEAFWHAELLRIYQEVEFEYEGEVKLIDEFIKVIEDR